MNRSIQQHRKAAMYRSIAVAAFLLLLSIALLSMGLDQLLVLLLVLGLGGAAYYFIVRSFRIGTGKRLVFLSATDMDPEALAAEAAEAYKKTDGSVMTQYGRAYYQAACHALLGEHEAALAICEAMPMPSDKYRTTRECNLMMCLVRCGRLSDGALHVDAVYTILDADRKMASSCHRVLGAYFTASGDIEKAVFHLAQAQLLASFRLEHMGNHYDLAQLAEKQGNMAVAAAHFRSAADLGPKTWFGQEAARRASALELTIGTQSPQ